MASRRLQTLAVFFISCCLARSAGKDLVRSHDAVRTTSIASLAQCAVNLPQCNHATRSRLFRKTLRGYCPYRKFGNHLSLTPNRNITTKNIYAGVSDRAPLTEERSARGS